MEAEVPAAPVLLIGAAHVVDLREAITTRMRAGGVDAIAVELDAERAAILLADHPEAHRPGKGAPLFLRVWSLLQRRLGSELGGGIAGSEMRAAAEVAREQSLPLYLIDDPIRETITRLVRSLTLRERILLIVGGLAGLVLPSRVVAGQIEAYAQDSSEYLNEIRRSYPSIARVLLDERNEHMAERLLEIGRQGRQRIAVVVGDAHVTGLAEALQRRGVRSDTVRFADLHPPGGVRA